MKHEELLLLAVLALPLRAGVGQERAIFGQVIDSVSGQPLRGTSAYFTTSRLEAHTNDGGFFVLHGDEKRDSVVVVRRIGYVPRTIVVSPLTKLPLVDVGIVYLRPAATKLDEIAVVGEEVRRYPQLDGFYIRRRHLGGLGHFLTREIIQRTGASRASDVLRRSNKVFMDCNRRTPSGECARRAAGRASSGSVCVPPTAPI